MLEILTAALLTLWVAGLVTGFSSGGGAIHILLLAAVVLHLIRRSSEARARSSSSAFHRQALIPGRRLPAPKGDIPMRPRANFPARRPAEFAPSVRPSIRRTSKPSAAPGTGAAKLGTG